MNSKLFLTLIIVVVAGVLGFALWNAPDQAKPIDHVNSAGKVHKLTVYKSATCGCCANWVAYMESVKNYELTVINSEEMNQIKEQYHVPSDLFACHTTIVNDGQYFIEGHMPEEVTAKLLEEEPNILGIGLPGMPDASPGMPGNKTAPFNIMQVDKDHNMSLFMSF